MNDPRQQGNSGIEQARNILIDAVDRVIRIATATGSASFESSHRGRDVPSCSQPFVAGNSNHHTINPVRNGRVELPPVNARSAGADVNRGEDTPKVVPIQEHRRLFGHSGAGGAFHPPKSPYSWSGKGKGKFKSSRRSRGRPLASKWKKDCVCLREMSQTRRPSAEERMNLARMGLGLEEICFDCDGDAEHIHSALLAKFPQLQTCGGYTLLRLSDSNSMDLIEIEHPAKGMNIRYLKDILNQAKLYIRPLQCDISPSMETGKEVIMCTQLVCLCVCVC